MLLVIIFIAGRITGPVAPLARAAERIGRGHLATAVPIETRDEIGALATTLDEPRASLAQGVAVPASNESEVQPASAAAALKRRATPSHRAVLR